MQAETTESQLMGYQQLLANKFYKEVVKQAEEFRASLYRTALNEKISSEQRVWALEQMRGIEKVLTIPKLEIDSLIEKLELNKGGRQ